MLSTFMLSEFCFIPAQTIALLNKAHKGLRCPCVGGRVVVVSAELHTLAADASPDYKYGSSQDAYNRRWGSPVVVMVYKQTAHCIISRAPVL